MAGFIGLTWRDSSGRRQQTKFNWNKAETQRLIGAAAAIALQKAGMEVRRSTQRMMVGGSTPQGRKPLSKPRWWKVGEKDGYPVVAAVYQIPRPEKVSSWAPRAFLRNDVESDFDTRTKSVVIGPSKFPWLNQLHEFGGAVRVFVRHADYPVKQFLGQRVPRKYQRSVKVGGGKTQHLGAYVGLFSNTSGRFSLGTRNVRGRAYMEIGLQRSLNKIPKQFRNTIGYGTIRVFGEKGVRS